jgi:hypothetical protein
MVGSGDDEVDGDALSMKTTTIDDDEVDGCVRAWNVKVALAGTSR